MENKNNPITNVRVCDEHEKYFTILICWRF